MVHGRGSPHATAKHNYVRTMCLNCRNSVRKGADPTMDENIDHLVCALPAACGGITHRLVSVTRLSRWFHAVAYERGPVECTPVPGGKPSGPPLKVLVGTDGTDSIGPGTYHLTTASSGVTAARAATEAPHYSRTADQIGFSWKGPGNECREK
jgi:hypothetical protein